MGLDLYDALDSIQKSKNYNFVRDVEERIFYDDSGPFYTFFGREEDIVKNLEIITNVDEEFIKQISVNCYLNSKKFLKCIIISVPECNNEMDSLYYSIAFVGQTPIIYNCELIEGEKFCLRKNDQFICKLFDKKPTPDEIWNIIENDNEIVEVDDAAIALRTPSEKDGWFFMIFNEKTDGLLEHWLDTKNYRKEFFTRNGVDYIVFVGAGTAKCVLRYDRANDKFVSVEYSDKDIVDNL